MKKVILITGASSGLGFSTAVQLAEQGHTVYAGIRNFAKAKKLQQIVSEKQLTLHLIHCDVNSSDSVNDAITTIIKQHEHIDCLINNAGIGFIKTTEQASYQEIQQVIDTNFMGVVRTTKAVLPWMRKAKKGHIINISSVGGLVGQPFNEIYCASKFALEGYTESLACYVKPFFNINFTIVEPGGIESDFAATTLAEYDPQTLDNDYQPIFKRYADSAQKRAEKTQTSSIYQSSNEVATCITTLVNKVNPPVRIRTSEWASEFCQLKTQADPNGDISVNKVYDLFLG